MHDGNLRGNALPSDFIGQIRHYAAQSGTGLEFHRFLLKYGQEFMELVWKRLPGCGQKKTCFLNAATLALSNPTLWYAEGFVWSDQVPILVEHAWCLDSVGRVIELTLRRNVYTGLRYFGVALDRSVLETTVKEGSSLPYLTNSRIRALDSESASRPAFLKSR